MNFFHRIFWWILKAERTGDQKDFNKVKEIIAERDAAEAKPEPKKAPIKVEPESKSEPKLDKVEPVELLPEPIAQKPTGKKVKPANLPKTKDAVKKYLYALRDDRTITGPAQNPTKRPGVDKLPKGCSLRTNPKRGFKWISVSKAFKGDFQSWDFTNVGIIVSSGATVDNFYDCVFGEDHVTGMLCYVDVLAGGTVKNIERFIVKGPFEYGSAGSAFGLARIKGTGKSTVVGAINRIAKGRIEGMASDGIKALGTNVPGQLQVIEDVYFGCMPCTKGAPKGADPHGDAITIACGMAGVKLKNIYIEMRPDPHGRPAVETMLMKINNGFRALSNSERGKKGFHMDHPCDCLEIENVIIDKPRVGTPSAAIHHSHGNAPSRMGCQVSVKNLWVSSQAKGVTLRFDQPKAIKKWNGVYDLDTDKPIPKPS